MTPFSTVIVTENATDDGLHSLLVNYLLTMPTNTLSQRYYSIQLYSSDKS